MLDWLADYLSLIMFVSMFFFIFMGYPVAFIMGGLALIFALAGAYRRLQPHRHLRRRAAHVGRCRRRSGARLDPMFIFMGAILERSGSAKDMLDATES